MPVSHRAGLLAAIVEVTGCTPLMPLRAPSAAGLTCDRLVVPTASLDEALRGAVAGDCVILSSGTYAGTFVPPAKRQARGERGGCGDPDRRRPGVDGEGGGKRSVVKGVRVAGSGGRGIAIDPGPAQLIGVAVMQTQRSALSISCAEADCGVREVVLTDVEVSKAPTGLRVEGAGVRVERGRIWGMRGTTLSSGSGGVATKGARLTLEGVVVEENENVGVLLDGAATRAAVSGCALVENRGRGLWAQGLAGAAATVTVSEGEVRGNGLVGIGARDVEGLVVRDTRVLDTRAARVAADFNRSDQVGDGVGLFAGARGVTLERVVAGDNARVQVLVDGPGDGLTLDGSFTGGRYRVAVQNASSAVQVRASLLDRPPESLVVRADALGLGP